MTTLRHLREIPLSELVDLQSPVQKIRYDEDVVQWKNTVGYQDYQLFLHRLNESVVGCTVPTTTEGDSEAITRLLTLLDTLDSWIDASPPPKPGTTPRFGNPAFRDYWGDRLSKECDNLLGTLLGHTHAAVLRFARPYLLESFGSVRRLDYGTGHETAFGLFLCTLALVRVVHPTDERALVLRVFVRYIRLCWRLQDTYRLEPAGSHGVWGLDDYSFLPYVFGSGQLRDQAMVPVNAVLGITAKDAVEYDNLYFMAVARIHRVKVGPFFEHSSQLYAIAMHVPSWAKVNKGLFEMYQAEVLGKRVVVQHLPLGGLIEWDRSFPASLGVFPLSD